jgi:hypothetical protein
VRHLLNRKESLDEIARKLDVAMLNADGATVLPYLWEEEVRANKLTAEKVSRILREVVLPRYGDAELRAARRVYQTTEFQGLMYRIIPTEKGNVREWFVDVRKVGDSGRLSLTMVVVGAHHAEIDNDPETISRQWPAVVATNLRKSQPELKRLGFTTFVYQDYETGTHRRKPLTQAIQMYQVWGKRLAAGLPVSSN